MIDELVKIIATSIRFISNGKPPISSRGGYTGTADIRRGPKSIKTCKSAWYCKKPDIKIPMENEFLDTNLDEITENPRIVEKEDYWHVTYPYKKDIESPNMASFMLFIYKKDGNVDMQKTILNLQGQLAGYCGRLFKNVFQAPNGDLIPNEVGIEMNFQSSGYSGGTCDVCCADNEQFPYRFEPFLSLPGNNWVCKECIGLYRLRSFGRALRRKKLLPMGLKF